MSQNDGSDPNMATDQTNLYMDCAPRPPHISDECSRHDQLHLSSSNLTEVQSL